MKFISVVVALLGSVVVVDAAPATYGSEAAASRQIARLQSQGNRYLEAQLRTRKSGCTSKNVMRRQEWGSLSKKDRLDYIQAVKCMQSKPPKSSKAAVPGARNRYDDFVATHIVHTPSVHFSGLFFHFHRFLVHTWEKALRDECGYRGNQPYWDWTIDWEDPTKSSVFDGSPYSMGGNGKPLANRSAVDVSAFGINLSVPPGDHNGGGCVVTGPFTNYTLHLGPVAFEPRGADGGLAYNPRCLTRDLSSVWTNKTRPTTVAALLASTGDLGTFDTNVEALDGVHASGHFAMGGIGIDAFSAAADPAFWLHHGMVDRTFTIWQNIDPRKRTQQTYGTSSAFNNPPTANVTLDTLVDFGVLAPQQAIRSLVSTIDGPFCYMYV